MKNKPRFSIITVCFNSGINLEKTIKSVVEQNYDNYEYIVIDGGSKDGTKELLKKYDKYIKYWVSEPDEGIYNAMNKGAKVAKGEYLYFLNAGDTLESEKTLGKVVSELDSVNMLYGNIRIVSKDGKKNIIKKKVLNKRNLKIGKKVSQQVIFVKRDFFNKLGGLDERYMIAADFDLLCKVFENTNNIKHIDEIICNYDDGGISSNLRKSYNDTSKVIKNRYGILSFCLYKVITSAKLFLSLFIIQR